MVSYVFVPCAFCCWPRTPCFLTNQKHEFSWIRMNCWQDVTNSCRCHHNFKFSSNNLNDSGLEILNRTRVTRIKCSFLWIHGLFNLTGNAPEVDQMRTHFPKSGGGISFVIGSRENCWKTAVEAYFWKVFKKKMTLSEHSDFYRWRRHQVRLK